MEVTFTPVEVCEILAVAAAKRVLASDADFSFEGVGHDVQLFASEPANLLCATVTLTPPGPGAGAPVPTPAPAEVEPL